LAIRLPKAVIKLLRLKGADSIEAHIPQPRGIETERVLTAQELLKRLRKFRGRQPAGFRFERLEANERN
jgi:antitoxin MazE